MNALIPTIAELKDDLYGYISDASKDAQGFRTRMDISDMTIEELMVEADYWEGRVIEAIEEDKIREAAAVKEFEETIAKIIGMGAGDRETAIRWMKGDDEWYINDESYFEYSYGLPYGYISGVKAGFLA
jgi:hypothetical protein